MQGSEDIRAAGRKSLLRESVAVKFNRLANHLLAGSAGHERTTNPFIVQSLCDAIKLGLFNFASTDPPSPPPELGSPE